MENVDKIFLAALNSFLDERGAKAALSKKTGIAPQYFGKIAAGTRYGSEETRRSIAAALGFPGRRYENFLDIGRAILEGKPAPEPGPEPLDDFTDG